MELNVTLEKDWEGLENLINGRYSVSIFFNICLIRINCFAKQINATNNANDD